MNTFGLVVFFFAVATASAYNWEVRATTGDGEYGSQMGNIILHVNQGGVTGMLGMKKTISFDEYGSPGFKHYFGLERYHTYAIDTKANSQVSSIKGVSFEWKKDPQDQTYTHGLSLSKVVITPNDDNIPYQKRKNSAVEFCYDGPNVKPGTVVQMKKCRSFLDSFLG